MFDAAGRGFGYGIKLDGLCGVAQLGGGGEWRNSMIEGERKWDFTFGAGNWAWVGQSRVLCHAVCATGAVGFHRCGGFVCWFARPVYGCRGNAVVRVDFLEGVEALSGFGLCFGHVAGVLIVMRVERWSAWGDAKCGGAQWGNGCLIMRPRPIALA